MKENAKMIIIIVAATLLITVGCFVNFKNNTKERTAILEFTKYDAKDNSKAVYYTLPIKEKDVVNLDVELSSITDNNIAILEINDKNIKISREVTKYKIISEYEKKAEPYKETIVQTIKYGEEISIDADDPNPFLTTDPLVPQGAPRYRKSVTVLKEKKKEL